VSRSRWCAELGTISFELDAGSTRHTVTWSRGRLSLRDHDLESEAVLRALGGEPCPCLSVLDALREAERSTGRPIPPAALEQIVRGRQFASMAKGQQEQLLALLRRRTVMGQLPQRMADVVGQASEVRRERRMRGQATRRAEPASAEERLQQAVAAACEVAIRRSRRDLRPYASLRIECWRRRADEEPLLKGVLDATGGFLALSLPVSWLNRVWKRGLAVVDGHFVLDVDRPAPAVEAEGLAVRWERRVAGPSVPAAVPCSLRRLPDRTWTLAW